MAKPPSNRKKTTSAASPDSTSAASSVNEDISQQVDPGSATITVTAVEVPELSEEEQRDRLHLERRVERAVFEALKALMELRDRRLYRSTHTALPAAMRYILKAESYDRRGARRKMYCIIAGSAVRPLKNTVKRDLATVADNPIF